MRVHENGKFNYWNGFFIRRKFFFVRLNSTQDLDSEAEQKERNLLVMVLSAISSLCCH